MDIFDGILSLGSQALAISLFLLVGMAVTALIKRSKLVRLDAVTGQTMHGGITLMLAGVLGLFTIVIIATGIYQWEYTRPQLGIWVVLILIFGAATICYSTCATCSWRWDADGITYRDIFKSQTIRWSEISEVSADWHNLWRIQSADRRKICWSKFVIGWNKINEAVTLYRPGLASFLEFKRFSA